MSTAKNGLISICLYCLFISQSVFAQTQTLDEISKLLKDWSTNDETFSHSNFSFSLRDETHGNILLSHKADQSLVPASNLKILTTITALELLGKNFKFKTSLEYSGKLDNGVLEGHVYLIGGGDPTIGSEKIRSAIKVQTLLDTLVQKLRIAGIQKIKGNIYVDGDYFPFNSIPNGWTWGDVGNYYGAAAGGMNLNDNLFSIYFKPGLEVGDSTHVIRTDPEIPGLILKNMVLTGQEGSGDHASVYGGHYTFFRYMIGTVPKGKEQFSIKASMPDPAIYASQILYSAIQKAGIQIEGKALKIEPGFVKRTAGRNIHDNWSPPVGEIIQETNMQSLNLFAESLYKMSAMKIIDQFSYDSASVVFKAFWKSKGMDIRGLNIEDGCGLSFTNTITANQISFLLDYVKERPYFNTFFKSLPISGISGTLSRITKGTAAHGKIHAKTGTQTRVSCYSGYIDTKKGKLLPFSLLINNYEGKPAALSQKVEKLFVLLSKL